MPGKYSIVDASQQPQKYSVVDAATREPDVMMAAPSRGVGGFLQDAEDDLRQGGNRTIVGHLLGELQGRGNEGYTGLRAGVSPGVAEFMGSPELGTVKMARGAHDLVTGSPWRGAKELAGGALQAFEIPSLIAGPGVADAAMDAIPSAARAGRTLEDIRNAAHDVPVELKNTQPALERFEELTQRGGKRSKPFTQLYKRVVNAEPDQIPNPFYFPEARDFYTNVTDAARQTPLQKIMGRGMKPTMLRQATAVRSGLNQDLTNAAESVGRGEDYAKAMKEYAQAKKIQKWVRRGTLLGAGEAARRTGLLGNWIHRTALTN